MSQSRFPLAPSALALALTLALSATPSPAQETASDPAPEADANAEAGGAPAEGAGQQTMAMEDVTARTVVATVGDYELTLGELIAVRQQLPQQYQQLPPEVLLEGLTQQLVNQVLLAERGREQGLDERTDVELRLRNHVSSTIAEAYLRDRLAERVSEERIVEAYGARFANAEPVEEVRAAHILVDSQEKAADLRAQIEEGADFAALAAEHGTDGTASRGGDLGYFSKADMVPEFAEAAFAMEVGTVSDPVETPFGWHLIKLDDRRDKPVPPLESVREQIVAELTEEARQQIVEDAAGDVEVTRPDRALPPQAIMADGLLSPSGD